MSVVIKRKEASLSLLREGWTSYLVRKLSPKQRYKILKLEKGELTLQNEETGLIFISHSPKVGHDVFAPYDLVQEPNPVQAVKKKGKTLKPQYISLKESNE